MKEIEYDGPSSEQEKGGAGKRPLPPKAPTVRTFRTDVQERIKEQGVTKTDIALAEAARREARGESRFPVEEGPRLGMIIFLLSLVLAFAIGVGGYALLGSRIGSFFGAPGATTTPEATLGKIEVSITDSPREQVLADISIAFGKTFLPTGGMREIRFTIKDDEGERDATSEEFLRALTVGKFPADLVVSLAPKLSYRVYSSSTLSGVIVLTSRSYASTFAAMLSWEPRIADSLLLALDPLYPRRSIRALSGRAFKDELAGTVSVRTLYDLDGTPVLSYGFLNKRTLLIAGGTDPIKAIAQEGR